MWSSTSATGTIVLITELRFQSQQSLQFQVHAKKKKKEFTRDGDEPFAGSLGGFKAA